MEAVFGFPGDLSIQKILKSVVPFRTYYYDCVEEKPRDSERQEDFEQRVAAQNAYTSQLHSLPGVHVRLGTLAGRKRRQKEVDVLLAVDMLTHGFNRNMGRAALLSGDLDFRPVVEALVRGGIFVEMWCREKKRVRSSVLGRRPRSADKLGQLVRVEHRRFHRG